VRDLVKSMVYEYGMGSSLSPQESDIILLTNKLYDECRTLLTKYERNIDKLEAILSEYESVSKALARESLNDIL
jgi:hypothetical protein